MDDGRLEDEHGKLDYRDSADDEEVRLLPHRKGAGEPDPPGSEIRDGPNTSDTQRDEWLLKTEPHQGARLKWNKGERPPVMADRTGVLDLEATGGVGGRNVEHHGIPTPLLPLERQILQEAEVTTHEQCLRFLRTSGQVTSVRTNGMMPGHMEMCWLTRWLRCSRICQISELRTGCCEHRGFHLWCVPLDRRRS